MGDHDVVLNQRDDLGNWHIRCRCGRDFRRVSKRWSVEAHHAHFLAETTGKPGVEQARRALEGKDA